MATFLISAVPNAPHEDERIYAFFYSGDYETITGKKMRLSKNVRRYLCISNKYKRVYKQYNALRGISKGVIALDYESRCNLNVEIGDKVEVKPISKIRYNWCTSDSLAKFSIIVAIISLALTLYAMH